MLNKSIKLLNLLGLLGAVAWLASKCEWEPAITSVGLFASLLTLEYSEHKTRSANHFGKTDQVLFERFCTEFPSDGKSVHFLRNPHFDTPYQNGELDEIDNFLKKWHTADCEFQNASLESWRSFFYFKLQVLKGEIIKLPTDFLSALARHFSDPDEYNFDSYGFFYGEENYIDKVNQQKLYAQELHAIEERINQMAADAYTCHQIIVREGRKLLD